MYFDIFISKLDCSFHRMVGQFRLEGTPGGLWSNGLPEVGSAMGTHQVVQGFTQPTLENMQEQRHHNLCGQQRKCFLLHLNLSFINFLLLPCLSTMHHCEKSGFISITTQSCLLSKSEQAPIFHPLFTGQVEPHREPPYWWLSNKLTPV